MKAHGPASLRTRSTGAQTGHTIWLFADTVAGARASANLYGLIETAKANGIEPSRYLAHLFEVLPTVTEPEQLDALLPQNLGREALRGR